MNDYRALYINDTYQVSRRLTLTLGLRWELPGMYSEKKDRLDGASAERDGSLVSEDGVGLERATGAGELAGIPVAGSTDRPL